MKDKVKKLRSDPTISDDEFRELFSEWWREIKGRTDIKSKLMLLLDPNKPQTTTFLNKHQAHYVGVSYFMKNRWEEFSPMEEYAIQLCLSAMGIEGKGIDSSIRLTGALSETKMLQHLGLQIKKEEK